MTTGSPREVRYIMAVKDANDTSVYETQSGSKIIIGRAARARADLIKKFREQNENSTSLETRHRQGRIVNNNVALSPESRIVNDPEAYAHIPAFGGIPQGGFQPVEVRLEHFPSQSLSFPVQCRPVPFRSQLGFRQSPKKRASKHVSVLSIFSHHITSDRPDERPLTAEAASDKWLKGFF